MGLKNYFSKDDQLIFITTNYFSSKFNVRKQVNIIKKKNNLLGKYKIISVNTTPNGPGETIKYGLKFIKNNDSLTVINCDQFLQFDFPKKLKNNEIYVPVYFNNKEHSSYVGFKKNGNINKIIEKKPYLFMQVPAYIFLGQKKLF